MRLLACQVGKGTGIQACQLKGLQPSVPAHPLYPHVSRAHAPTLSVSLLSVLWSDLPSLRDQLRSLPSPTATNHSPPTGGVGGARGGQQLAPAYPSQGRQVVRFEPVRFLPARASALVGVVGATEGR